MRVPTILMTMMFHYHKQLSERITQIEHVEAKVDGLYYSSRGKKKKWSSAGLFYDVRLTLMADALEFPGLVMSTFFPLTIHVSSVPGVVAIVK